MAIAALGALGYVGALVTGRGATVSETFRGRCCERGMPLRSNCPASAALFRRGIRLLVGVTIAGDAGDTGDCILGSGWVGRGGTGWGIGGLAIWPSGALGRLRYLDMLLLTRASCSGAWPEAVDGGLLEAAPCLTDRYLENLGGETTSDAVTSAEGMAIRGATAEVVS